MVSAMSGDVLSAPPITQLDPVVSLQGVTKTYTIWDEPSARLFSLLRSTITGAPAKGARQFTAVNNISLEIRRGECLGIIGRNGAGKSTLLQMIAGTLQPTAGDISVTGRVAALLELGSGFDPNFTGRENIHLNASILGLTKSEIDAKFEAIVDYSGIREFIDQPVRTYSSGMAVRLAFAVCAHVDADILIIDEALAVGDARFQFKCHATLDQMIADGRTIIFVSHDTNSVKRICDRAVLLERGEMVFEGKPNDVVNLYTKLITSPHGLEAIRPDIEALRLGAAALPPTDAPPPPPPTPHAPSPILLAKDLNAEHLVAEERSHQQISDKEYSYGGELGRIEDVALLDENGTRMLSFVTGTRARIRLTCRAAHDVIDPIYAVTLKDVRGQEIFGTNTYFQNLPQPVVLAGAGAEALFDLQLNILPGVYFISCGWVRIVDGEVQVIHRRYDAIRFDVLPRDRSFGIAYCPTRISVRAL
jgi:ABC-type polysaccharide/polyol phosphate transport system, ATPase component